MRNLLTGIAFACMGFAAASQAATITYDLASDFSTTSNPNGVWSFVQGTTPLSFQAAPSDGNALDGAATNGFFGTADNFSTSPFVIQTSENGSATGSYNDEDFLKGDIIAHSTNSGAGDPLYIEWTAPEDGMITFNGDVWYAHSPVTRSNNYVLSLGGVFLGSDSVFSGRDRDHADTFDLTLPIAVTAGEVFALELTPTAGQSFGSLAGVNMTVNFTADDTTVTPEPGTTTLFGIGLVGAVFFASRRRAISAR